jgi:3-deoxy-D-manno-octulosonic-acid transferase
MSRFLYSLLLYVLTPLVLLRLCFRSRKAPAYRRRIAERFGFFSPPEFKGGIWVHAVSVGETLAAAPLIQHFLNTHPDVPLIVTTMTPTGSERVQALFGDRVFHVYAPYDLPCSVSRFLRRLAPRLAVIMETEVWPNMVVQTAAQGIPVVLANGRMSARSAKGYQRFSRLIKPAFASFAQVVAQSEDDARRFISLGAVEDHVQVSGSIKFDVSIGDDLRRQAEALRAALGSRPVWIAASTHPGEEEAVLAAHYQVLSKHPDAVLILVPRHPERFDGVADLLSSEGVAVARRSSGAVVTADTQVLLGDTMGELMMFYGAADVAFVGGSLIARGGHNMLEPAAWALPIVCGPSDFNFAEISSKLSVAGGMSIVADGDALGGEVASLLSDTAWCQRRGQASLAVVDANRGALNKLIATLTEVAAL